MTITKRLINQINEAPDPLRDYIHELEAYIGNGANMVQDIFQLKEDLAMLIYYAQQKKDREDG